MRLLNRQKPKMEAQPHTVVMQLANGNELEASFNAVLTEEELAEVAAWVRGKNALYGSLASLPDGKRVMADFSFSDEQGTAAVTLTGRQTDPLSKVQPDDFTEEGFAAYLTLIAALAASFARKHWKGEPASLTSILDYNLVENPRTIGQFAMADSPYILLLGYSVHEE